VLILIFLFWLWCLFAFWFAGFLLACLPAAWFFFQLFLLFKAWSFIKQTQSIIQHPTFP